MDKIEIANILLTRRCNLRCGYCNIVRNYDNMPESYHGMDYYAKNELDVSEWMNIFDRIVKNNSNVFFIIYGGEPFLYDNLWRLIIHCNINNYNYTVITNNTDEVQQEIKDTYDICGKFKGFTSSVDPIVSCDINEQLRIYKEDVNVKSIIEKSKKGLQRLIEMKENNIADDIVAELTVMKSTVPYLYKTIKTLSEHGIYSSISTLDDNKNPFYDFARTINEDEMIGQDVAIRNELDLIKNDDSLLIHIPDMLDILYDMLPSTGDCGLEEDIHNVTVDSDGSFRLCLRIKGVSTPSLSLDDAITIDGLTTKCFSDALTFDKKHYCQKCNWTCPQMSKLFTTQIVNHK